MDNNRSSAAQNDYNDEQEIAVIYTTLEGKEGDERAIKGIKRVAVAFMLKRFIRSLTGIYPVREITQRF